MSVYIYGYEKEEDGTYTVLRNKEKFLCGICDAMEAAKIVESLLKDESEEANGQALDTVQ